MIKINLECRFVVVCGGSIIQFSNYYHSDKTGDDKEIDSDCRLRGVLLIFQLIYEAKKIKN